MVPPAGPVRTGRSVILRERRRHFDVPAECDGEEPRRPQLTARPVHAEGELLDEMASTAALAHPAACKAIATARLENDKVEVIVVQ